MRKTIRSLERRSAKGKVKVKRRIWVKQTIVFLGHVAIE